MSISRVTGGHVLYLTWISRVQLSQSASICLSRVPQLWTCFRSQSRVQSLASWAEQSRGPHPCLDSVIYRPVLGALSCLQPPCHCIPRALSSPTPIWHETQVSGVTEHSVMSPDQIIKRNLNDRVILLDWQLKFISRSFKFPNSKISICKQEATIF